MNNVLRHILTTGHKILVVSSGDISNQSENSYYLVDSFNPPYRVGNAEDIKFSDVRGCINITQFVNSNSNWFNTHVDPIIFNSKFSDFVERENKFNMQFSDNMKWMLFF